MTDEPIVNIRIDIDDLVRAARALGEFKVVAAGIFWATIETTQEQRLSLLKFSVRWSFD